MKHEDDMLKKKNPSFKLNDDSTRLSCVELN